MLPAAKLFSHYLYHQSNNISRPEQPLLEHYFLEATFLQEVDGKQL